MYIIINKICRFAFGCFSLFYFLSGKFIANYLMISVDRKKDDLLILVLVSLA